MLHIPFILGYRPRCKPFGLLCYTLIPVLRYARSLSLYLGRHCFSLLFFPHFTPQHRNCAVWNLSSLLQAYSTSLWKCSHISWLGHLFFPSSPVSWALSPTPAFMGGLWLLLPWLRRWKILPAMWENRVWSLGREDTLEKEMAVHSSILAWKIPRTEEPGRLQSMGSQRVGHNWAINTFFHGSRHIQLISISNAFFFCQCLCKVLFSLGHLIFLIPRLPLSGWFLHLLKISVFVSFSAWYSSSIDRVKYPCHVRSALYLPFSSIYQMYPDCLSLCLCY